MKHHKHNHQFIPPISCWFKHDYEIIKNRIFPETKLPLVLDVVQRCKKCGKIIIDIVKTE